MSEFKKMTYEQKIGKAFFDLSQEISNTEIKKLRRQIKKLEDENLELKQANGATTGTEQCNLPVVIHCPDWLHENHKLEAIRLYKIKKIDGLKYLTYIARKHLTNPLKWSHDFLKGCV